MEIWEIILIGVALSMDAVAVGATNGMTEPKMKWGKLLLIAATFGLFQFGMPVIGYYFGYAFSSLVEKIAPWLSFALLAFIGGKMIADCAIELHKKRKGEEVAERKPLGAGKLLLQGVATSLDALAVGVTLLAAETTKGLPIHAVLCALVIGAITFSLVVPAVLLGKKVGGKFADKAGFLGGAVLIAIGIKILIEGLL